MEERKIETNGRLSIETINTKRTLSNLFVTYLLLDIYLLLQQSFYFKIISLGVLFLIFFPYFTIGIIGNLILFFQPAAQR